MVEHLVYTERVGGSSPSPPTRVRRAALFILLSLWGWAGVTTPSAAQLFGRGPMKFSVEELRGPECGAHCPKVVVAEGVIEEQTPEAFLEFARHAAFADGLRAVVFIDSPGGNVVASMELGTAFRKLRLSAIVANYESSGGFAGPVGGQCVSACVYALMGAVRRISPPISRIALHRMSIVGEQGGERRFADARLVGIVARYAQRMGVSPALVWAAESMPPDHVRILSQREMSAWRLATTRF